MTTSQKKTILIVEDEKPLAEALVDKFVSEGFDMLVASDGEEGLDVALKNHPDLILLDIVMPKMDGMTMMKKLREDDWGKSVSIILLTNLSASGTDIVEGIVREEPAYYLVKSDWSIGDIVEKVREVLEK